MVELVRFEKSKSRFVMMLLTWPGQWSSLERSSTVPPPFEGQAVFSHPGNTLYERRMPAHFHVVAYPVVPLELPSLESLVVVPGPSRQQDRSRRSSGMHQS